jgi:hypothetical protein
VAAFALGNEGSRIGVVAPTFSDARDTCVEGDSGLLKALPPICVETWNRSQGELILKNGSRFKLFSADEPERLRGPQFHRAEAGSADPWTSRARPSFLYLMYVLLLLCVFGGILGIWYPSQTAQAAININALLKALPPDLYTLFGLGYLGYTGARSFEKWQFGKTKK